MPTTKTTQPTDRPDFLEWCNTLKVATADKDMRPIDKITRLTKLWNGYLDMKEDFVKPIIQKDMD